VHKAKHLFCCFPPPKHDFLDETLVTQVQIKYFIRVEFLYLSDETCLPAEVHPQTLETQHSHFTDSDVQGTLRSRQPGCKKLSEVNSSGWHMQLASCLRACG